MQAQNIKEQGLLLGVRSVPIAVPEAREQLWWSVVFIIRNRDKHIFGLHLHKRFARDGRLCDQDLDMDILKSCEFALCP